MFASSLTLHSHGDSSQPRDPGLFVLLRRSRLAQLLPALRRRPRLGIFFVKRVHLKTNRTGLQFLMDLGKVHMNGCDGRVLTLEEQASELGTNEEVRQLRWKPVR